MKKFIPILAIVLLLQPSVANANRLFMSGFEWQTTTTQVEVGTAQAASGFSIDTTIKHAGSASLEISSIAAGARPVATSTFTGTTALYARAYVYVDSMAASSAGSGFFMHFFAASSGQEIAAVTASSTDGSSLSLYVYYNDYASVLPNTASLSFDRWHRIELFFDSSGAGSTDSVTVQVDGIQVAHSSSLNLTATTPTEFQVGYFNGSGSTDSTTVMYVDDLAVNNTSGSQTSWPGDGNIVILVPTGAGTSACTTGTFSMINEKPPSDTATSGSTMCELDANPTTGNFAVTDSSTVGINQTSTISVVSIMARIREESAGNSNYTIHVTSGAGTATTTSSSVDAGNATARTNPNSTTPFGNMLFSYTNPMTSAAWTPTGTNSIDSMRIGAGRTDGNPDTWMLTIAAMVEFVEPNSLPGQPRLLRLGTLILLRGTLIIR